MPCRKTNCNVLKIFKCFRNWIAEILFYILRPTTITIHLVKVLYKSLFPHKERKQNALYLRSKAMIWNSIFQSKYLTELPDKLKTLIQWKLRFCWNLHCFFSFFCNCPFIKYFFLFSNNYVTKVCFFMFFFSFYKGKCKY